jgi:hypothetical protein
MEMNEALIILCSVSIVVLAAYNIYFFFKFNELPSSLSNSSYYFQNINKKLSYIFTLAMWLILIPIIGVVFEVTEGKWWQFIGFLFIAGVGFVSVTPTYKDSKLENRVHKGGALFAVVGALFYCFSLQGVINSLAMFVIVCIAFWIFIYSSNSKPTGKYVEPKDWIDKTNIIYIVELATFITTYYVTLTYLRG